MEHHSRPLDHRHVVDRHRPRSGAFVAGAQRSSVKTQTQQQTQGAAADHSPLHPVVWCAPSDAAAATAKAEKRAFFKARLRKPRLLTAAAKEKNDFNFFLRRPLEH